jgi:hypothetical protein
LNERAAPQSKKATAPARPFIPARAVLAPGRTEPDTVPSGVSDALRSPGQPLDPGSRSYMEPRFRHDFGQVRVHPDARAAEAARRLNSVALTSGQDIFFGAGMYQPDKPGGRRLLAHELAHTIQQRGAQPRAGIQNSLTVSQPGDRLEQEADAAARRVADGHRISPGAISVGAAGTRGLIARQVVTPTRATTAGSFEAEELVQELVRAILRSLREDPGDASGHVRRRLDRLSPSTRAAVLELVEAQATPEQSARLARILAEPTPPETVPAAEETPRPEPEPSPEPPGPGAEEARAESREPTTAAGPEPTPTAEAAEPTEVAEPMPAAGEAAVEAAPVAPERPETAIEDVPVPEVQGVVPERAAESGAPAPPAAPAPAAAPAGAAPLPAAEEATPEADTGPIEELEAEEVLGAEEEGPEAELEDRAAAAEPARTEPSPEIEAGPEPGPEAATPEPAIEGPTEETPVEAGGEEGAIVEREETGGLEPGPGAETEPGGLDLGAALEEGADMGEEAPPGGGGGGGTPIPEPSIPEAPDVSRADPAQALAAVSELPPSRLAVALGGVSAAASRSVNEQRSELAANPPQVERPSGARTTQETPAAAREAPPVPEGPRRVERAPGGSPAPVPRPAPLPPEPAPPTQAVRPPQVGDAPQGGLSTENARAVRASLRSLPTHDPALDLTAGPPPALTLEGDADPERAREQRARLDESLAEARAQGQQDAAQPMGEDEIYPNVPQETLRAEVPAGGGAGEAEPAAAAGGAVGGDDEAASIIAQEQRGEEIRTAIAQARTGVDARRQEHAAQVAEQREDAQREMDELVNRNATDQARERAGAQAEVQELRGQWSEAQRDLVNSSNAEADAAVQEGAQDLTQERTQAEEKATQHIQNGNRRAAAARRQAEEQATRERQNAENKSEGILGWLADQATAFFNEVKNRIQKAFEAARAVVRDAIQAAQRLAADAIEAARRNIVGIIRRVGDALVSIGDRLLAGFPGLRDRFRAAIRDRVARAEAAVNRLAGELKDGVQRALNLLGSALNAALGLLERGMLAAVDVASKAVQGAIQFGRSVVQGFAAFAVLIRDVAANPGQWIRNLGAAIVDGIRNHLWQAFKTAIQNWFSSKVEEVLGLGMAVWQLLSRGGIALAQVGRMVWEGLKQVIPVVLIQILIQRLVSMIVPAVGAVMVIIETLQAAWGTVSRIIQAFERFMAFLRAVRTGNAGPPFAQALAAAAVAVIDFVSNFLLMRLRRPAGALAGRIRTIAQRIGQRLRGLTRGARQIGRRIRGGVRGFVERRRRPKRGPAEAPRETPGQRARALSIARRIAEVADRRNLSIRAALRRLATVKRRYRWIDRFEAQPKDAGKFSIYMIASKTEVRPEYTEEELAGEPRIDYGPLDARGRPTGVRALLKRPLNKGQEAYEDPPGFISGKPPHGHARGHLLGRQLGGAGRGQEGKRNLVTLYHIPVNTPIMRGYERLVRIAVEAGEAVEYSIIPIYRGTQDMPIAVTLRAKGSKGFTLGVTILNIPK